MIYTRAQWKAKRDAAGVKSGLVKGADIGPLLDKFHAAGKGKTGAAAMLAQVKTLTPLGTALKKYKVGLTPLNKPALMKIVDEMIKTVNDQAAMGAKLANPVLNVKDNITKTIANAKVVVASGDAAAYGKLWNGNVRGVGTGLAKLAQLDPKVKDIHANWLPYTAGAWDTSGKNVAGTEKDPAKKKAKIQAAAKEILGIAIKVQSEFKARKYWL